MRWVAATERGQYYPAPQYQEQWVSLGAVLQNRLHLNYMCQAMQPGALKMVHSRITNIDPRYSDTDTHLSYAELVDHDEAERAAGRPSLFIRANDQLVVVGQNRNAIAINFMDEWYIQLWVNRALALASNCENIWLESDNGIFDRLWFAPSTGWDAPYPQSNQAYMDAGRAFFQRVKEFAPDLKVAVNIGMQADPNQFQHIFEFADGLNFEFWPEAYQPKAALYLRQAMQWGIDHPDGILMLNSRFADEEKVLNSYMHYLIARNDNSFFGPQFDDIYREIPESVYAGARETLGWHTGAAVELAPNVYQRPHEGGMVYLNASEETGTIHVPAGYRDKTGGAVETIELAPLTGDYVVGNPQGCRSLLSLRS